MGAREVHPRVGDASIRELDGLPALAMDEDLRVGMVRADPDRVLGGEARLLDRASDAIAILEVGQGEAALVAGVDELVVRGRHVGEDAEPAERVHALVLAPRCGGNGLAAQVVANSRLGNIAVERTIQPFVGNLGDCIEYHLSLCGITTGIVIDPDFYLVDVQVPGGRENVYDRLRALGASYGFEVSLVSNNVVIRHPREREAINYRNASVDWQMDQSSLAQTVRGWYYNTRSGNDIAYPVNGDMSNVDVYQVDANEVKVYEIPLSASLSSVEQPLPVSHVSQSDMSASVYTISTVEGTVIEPVTWLNNGGSVRVEVSDDTKMLIVTITALLFLIGAW